MMGGQHPEKLAWRQHPEKLAWRQHLSKLAQQGRSDGQ
jgi:hypothetical protein